MVTTPSRVRSVATRSSIVAAAVAAGTLAGIRAVSPGTPEPIRDERGRRVPGSISEKVFLEVDGTRQGLFLRGVDATRPVLLVLHGGIPEAFLSARHPTGLEDSFVVAMWERRGSGMSFDPRIPPETMTLEQFVSDTLVVTDRLRQRFGQERIYLMAHSGGSFIGIHAAARSPERYTAYVGVAQMAAQLESEVLAYEYMLDAFRRCGDHAMVRRLEAAPVLPDAPPPADYLAFRDVAMHKLGIGTMHDMRSIVTGLFLPSLAFRGYTVREKVNLWRAKREQGVSLLWREMLDTDLATSVPSLEVPAYFLHGVYDYTCAYAPARAYAASLKAPLKGFYTFAHSAHSPVHEEPARALQILREDVLGGTNRLVDAPEPRVDAGTRHPLPSKA